MITRFRCRWRRAASAVASRYLAAAAAVPPSCAGVVVFAVNDIPTVMANTRTWLVGILAGAATVLLTVGGLRYLLAGGDPGEIEKAKTALKAAAIGYALAILAPILLAVLQGIVGDNTPGLPTPSKTAGVLGPLGGPR